MQLPRSFLFDSLPDHLRWEVFQALCVLHESGFFAEQERKQVEYFANQIAGSMNTDGFDVERNTIFNSGKLDFIRLVSNEAAALSKKSQELGDEKNEIAVE